MSKSARKPDLASELTRETQRFAHMMSSSFLDMAKKRDLVSEMFMNNLMEKEKEDIKSLSEFLEEANQQLRKKLNDKPTKGKRVVRRRRS